MAYPNDMMAPIPGGTPTNTAVNMQAAQAAAPAMAPIPGAPAGTVAPGVGVAAGAQQQPGFFQQGGMAQMGLGAIQTLGSLWNSFQQQKLAKDALSFQKDSFRTNMANQKKTYNTALEDRIRARYATEGRSDQADEKIQQNSL